MANLVSRDKMAKTESQDQPVFKEWLGNRELQVIMGRWVCKAKKVLLEKQAVKGLVVTLARREFQAQMDFLDHQGRLVREEHLVLQDHGDSRACLGVQERTE